MNLFRLQNGNSTNHKFNDRALLLIPLVLTCFALLPAAQAVVPAPDGGYANFNTAEGQNTLFSLTTGVFNTALGGQALHTNTTGNTNTAVGLNSLFFNNGSANVAVGCQALQSNTTGFHNTADGFQALFFNTSGNHNTANGDVALHRNTIGNFNTANGAHTLENNTTGSSNLALGFQAGSNITGSGNVCIGANVPGVAGESNTTRIRNIFSSVASGRAVFVNSDNKLGTLSSSRRFKEEIKPMDKASETLFALKPVTFRYKKEVDPARALSFGLIAEEVAEASSDLITRDEQGKPKTVRYEAVNAMLLNEFLKEHHRVQDLKAIVAEQQKQIQALTAGLRKVNAKVELTKPAPQTVLNQ